MAPVVQDAFRPTLPELLGPRRWRLTWAAALAVAAVVAVALLVSRSTANEHVVVGRGVPAFNFAYDAPLRRVGPATVSETRAGGVFVQSMRVVSLRLPAYRGDVGGLLPLLADRLARSRALSRVDLVVTDEGRARINDNPGYYVGWRATLRPGGRALFARDYLLVPGDVAHPVRGVVLELLGTHASGVNGTDDVGRIGALKQPLRSFRFGTERP
jgi:hypothetical protein